MSNTNINNDKMKKVRRKLFNAKESFLDEPFEENDDLNRSDEVKRKFSGPSLYENPKLI